MLFGLPSPSAPHAKRWASQIPPPKSPLMKNLPSVLAPLLFLACFSAEAATWLDIAGNDEVTVYVDTTSIRRTGLRVKTWLKWHWVKPQEVPNSFPLKTYLSEKQLQVSDCRDLTLAVAQGIRYAAIDERDIVSSYTFDERSWRFSEAAPETIGESIVRYACKQTDVKRK
jgi:hypothetical protein